MATTTVRSLDALYQALSQAQGGDTIELAGGNYGNLELRSVGSADFTFPSNVTITSADPANPAVFSGMHLRDVGNLTFDGITFDYTFAAGDQIYHRPFEVTSSDNIVIQNSTFDGDVARGVSDIDDGYGYAIGLAVRDSSGVTLKSNEVYDFHRGFVVHDSNDIEVRSNDVHSIRMDGMNFAHIDGVLIEGNYLHDFNVSPNSADHRDMIQFWTAGTTEPSTDITIVNNHLDIGTGGYTQSIFMRNEVVDRGLAGPEMHYQNVRIEDNLIVNAHAHGITVGQTDDLTIKNNSVLHADGDTPDGVDPGVEIPAISVSPGSTNVLIAQNITAKINGWSDQSDWAVERNAIVQDQDANADGYYGDVFIGSTLEAVGGVHNFMALSGGLIDRLGAGAAQTRAGVQNNELMPNFHIKTGDTSEAVRHFDASTTLLDGAALPQGTSYVWTFGDGQTGTGARVSHSYGDGGAYPVSLTIRLPDGRSERITTEVDVAGPSLLAMRADGHFTSYDAGAEEAVNLGGAATSEGLRLGVDGLRAKIESEFVKRLKETDEFSIDLSLKATTIGSKGEVFQLPFTIVSNVTAAGELAVTLHQTSGDRTVVVTTGGKLNNGQEHDISLTLKDGTVTISIDGKVNTTVSGIGELASSAIHDLHFGNPWGKENFDGMLTSFAISTDASDYGPTAPSNFAAPEATARPVTLADFAFETPLEPSEEAATLEPNVPDGAVRLGHDGIAARFEREDVSFLPGADAFDISLSLQASELGSGGEVFRLQNSLVAHVHDSGELVVRAFTTDGIHTRLMTSDANLADGAQHDISISLSDGILSVTINDGDRQTVALPEPLGDYGQQDLLIGNPRGINNFEGTIFSFEVSAPPAPGAPVTPPVTLDAAVHSGVSMILSSVITAAPENQATAPTIGQAVDGMETTIGPFEHYYHDLSYFYS